MQENICLVLDGLASKGLLNIESFVTHIDVNTTPENVATLAALEAFCLAKYCREGWSFCFFISGDSNPEPQQKKLKLQLLHQKILSFHYIIKR